MTRASDTVMRAKKVRTETPCLNIRNECGFLAFGYKATMSKSVITEAGLTEDKDSENHILRENQRQIERYLLFPRPYHTCT